MHLSRSLRREALNNLHKKLPIPLMSIWKEDLRENYLTHYQHIGPITIQDQKFKRRCDYGMIYLDIYRKNKPAPYWVREMMTSFISANLCHIEAIYKCLRQNV